MKGTGFKNLEQTVFKGVDEFWQEAAVDSCGDAYLLPKSDSNKESFLRNIDNTYQMFIGSGYETENWKTSLIKRIK